MRPDYSRSLLGYNENFTSGNYNAFYIELAQRFDDLMNVMTFYEGIVFFKIYVLHCPASVHSSNTRLLRFIEKLMDHYHSRWRFPRLLCIRGCSTTGHHYHLLFLIDPKKQPQRCNWLKKATELWQECIGVKGGHELVQLITTIGDRSSFTDFNLLEDKESFPYHFVRLIQVAKVFGECEDITKLPHDVMRF